MLELNFAVGLWTKISSPFPVIKDFNGLPSFSFGVLQRDIP